MSAQQDPLLENAGSSGLPDSALAGRATSGEIGGHPLSRIVPTGLKGDTSLTLGLSLLGALLFVAIFAGLLAPHDPLHQEITNPLAAPASPGHLLGTDPLGRDVLSRLIYAARTDIFVALGAVLGAFLFGSAVGILTGYRGGWADSLVVGVIDVIFAFPVIVLLIALVFVLGPGVTTIILAVTVVDWVAYARLARVATQRERTMDYVLAARVGGVPTRRILRVHILPNIIAQSIVYAMSDAVLIILFVTSLGFLGLGVPPPAPDWGTMIAEAQPYWTTQWWLAVAPGLAIVITGLALSLIADGLAKKLRAT